MIWSIMDHKMALILDQLKNDATAASLECIRCTRIEAVSYTHLIIYRRLTGQP